MTIIDMLFSIARNITDGDINELNKLHERAKNETVTYHTEQKGFKGLYAKINQMWVAQLIFVFASPFITAYLIKYKNKMLNENLRFDEGDDDEEYDDDEERDEFERLKRKYG